MTKPLHRLPATDRRALVDGFAGHDVTLYIDVHRDGSVLNEYPGRLIGVASTNNGTSSDLVVLRLRRGLRAGGSELVAMSIATVAGFRTVAGAPYGRCPEAPGE